VDIRGLKKVWKKTDVVQERFCNKVLRIPRFSANSIAELEFGRYSRRGKVLCWVVKYFFKNFADGQGITSKRVL
jgi:hypothetical protein